MTLPTIVALLTLFCLLSLLAFGMGLIAWIEVKALQKSTHSIQYVPAGQDFEKVTRDLEAKLNKDIFEAV
jgi:CHASE3 domain sensor protein